VSLDDGSVQTISTGVSPAPVGGGDAWNREGTILYSSSPGTPIWRVPASGGEPIAATRFEGTQRSHSSPQFLPDGRHFLFFVIGPPDSHGVHLGQLDNLESNRLVDADTPAVYAPTGHRLFARDGKLLAQAFDADRLELRGNPFVIDEQVTAGTRLSASAAGPIVYRTPPPDSGQRQLAWVDRTGKELDKVLYPDDSALGPAVSHDGRRVAVFRLANGNMDIWAYETQRRTWDRLTFDPGDDIYPLWSGDGTRIAFGSRRGSMDLYWKLLSGPPGSEQRLPSTPQPKFPMDWSRDGRFLLYNSLDPKSGVDIWGLPLEGSREPFEVIRTSFNEQHPQLSPDGRWVAYQSDRTGRFEVYIRPFPGSGADVPVSTDGGTQVRWHPSGGELFYIAPDDRLMAVPVRATPDRRAVELGVPHALFATNVGSTAPNTNRQQYAVSPDGESFVMNSAVEEPSAAPLVVILNWKPQP
jgi:Tol biopolymer transport system component